MKKYILVSVFVSVALLPFVAFAASSGSSNTNPFGATSQSLTTVNSLNPTSYQSSSSGCQTPQDLAGLFTYSLCLLTYYVTPFLFGLAGVVFIVGVVNYVRAGDNEEKRGQGRDLMWFGIIALFVMITVWGFVNILSKSIFGRDSQLPNLPRQATSVFQQ